MIGETELIYREEQRFALWLRWLVVLSMIWIAARRLIKSFPQDYLHVEVERCYADTEIDMRSYTETI